MPALSGAGELPPRVVPLTTAQFFVAGHEIQVRGQPPHRQIAQQIVDEPRAAGALEVGVHRVAGRHARGVATRKQRHDHSLDAHAPIVTALDAAVRSVTGEAPTYAGVPFWCDLVALKDHGVPGVNFGPGDPPYNFADEFVLETQYLEAVDVYEQLIRSWCT